MNYDRERRSDGNNLDAGTTSPLLWLHHIDAISEVDGIESRVTQITRTVPETLENVID